uniref:Uncharacterized protein n=1 Tax=Peronospora matthiolae TaxID=2874970 RepID=A0AAV1TS50_9STRA
MPYSSIDMEEFGVDCKIGFLLGYREDIVGCHVYFPTEHKKDYVSNVKINESIAYKDPYEATYTSRVYMAEAVRESIEANEIDVGNIDVIAADGHDKLSHEAEASAVSDMCTAVDMISQQTDCDIDMISYQTDCDNTTEPFGLSDIDSIGNTPREQGENVENDVSHAANCSPGDLDELVQSNDQYRAEGERETSSYYPRSRDLQTVKSSQEDLV